jgi:hypothetical protein
MKLTVKRSGRKTIPFADVCLGEVFFNPVEPNDFFMRIEEIETNMESFNCVALDYYSQEFVTDKERVVLADSELIITVK